MIASLLRYVLLEGSVALFALGALVSILPEDGHTEPPPPLFGECAVAKEALLGEECPRHALGARTLTAAKLLILARAKFPQLLHLLPDLKGDLRRHSMLRKSASADGGGSAAGAPAPSPAAANAMAPMRDPSRLETQWAESEAREKLLTAESETRAATLISATARGRTARKEVQQMRTGASLH